VNWSAPDCRTESGTTRVYFGSDGVMVPLVTDAEKKARRQKSKRKRRQRGRKARPLPPPKAGADQKYKEFKIVAYYDETQRSPPMAARRLLLFGGRATGSLPLLTEPTTEPTA
jgi:hypothetical protein